MTDKIQKILMRVETDLDKQELRLKRKIKEYEETGKNPDTQFSPDYMRGVLHAYAVARVLVTDARHDIMRIKATKTVDKLSKM